MNYVLFNIMWTARCVVYLGKRCTRLHYAKKVSRQRQSDDLGNVLLGNFGSCIHVDVTLTRTTYLNITADQVHFFMTTVFPEVVASFSRIMHPATLQKLFRNSLRNMTKSSKC
ncbi:hypothetical protein LDENG_00218890 [Lucifuga dentata]|nr:hypothetical protein LDENG_00218890 [Lucifuga dentata]